MQVKYTRSGKDSPAGRIVREHLQFTDRDGSQPQRLLDAVTDLLMTAETEEEFELYIVLSFDSIANRIAELEKKERYEECAVLHRLLTEDFAARLAEGIIKKYNAQ